MSAIFNQYFSKRWSTFFVGLLLVVSGLSACGARTPTSDATQNARKKLPMGTTIGLTLVGYNYTNRYIDEFSVDGVGGGNLFVSGPTSGGGGDVCCVNYITGPGEWKVHVKWQADACTYDEHTWSNGEKHSEIYSYFKEADVLVDPHVPDHPAYFEVHFYPDGHVEAVITEHASPPRLKLSKSREDRSPYRQCPNDKKPEV